MLISCVNLNFKACLLNKMVLSSVCKCVRGLKLWSSHSLTKRCGGRVFILCFYIKKYKLKFCFNLLLRNRAILPITKLLLTFRFYALETILLAAGDFVGVSKTSACNIVRTVTEAITSLRPLYIKMPDHHCSIQETRLKFYNIARFPRIIGVINCTHVKLL